MIRQWIEFARRPELRSRVVFLSDYDVLMAEHLVQGVDVWVNTPRRPWEASGTSGMKVLVNGGLNLSELDGWWAEAYSPEVGWAIGDRREHGDDPAWDAAEARNSLRVDRTRSDSRILYPRRARNSVAPGWLACAKAWRGLTPAFLHQPRGSSIHRGTLPIGCRGFPAVAPKSKAHSEQICSIGRSELAKHWAIAAIWFGDSRKGSGQYVFQVQVFLDDLDPDAVKAELYAEGQNSNAPVTQPLIRGEHLVGSSNGFTYTARVPASRPAIDYTPRLVPAHSGAHVPLESSFILVARLALVAMTRCRVQLEDRWHPFNPGPLYPSFLRLSTGIGNTFPSRSEFPV